MSTIIREAREDDIAFLAWVMLAASRSHLPRGLWDLMLDSDEECLALLEHLARAKPETFSHWRGFLVAEVDGERAAALSGYDPGLVADPDLAVGTALVEMGWSAERLVEANARFAPFLTCMPDQPPGAWVVEWVAARPEFRRRGLVDLLLEEILERGRARGYTAAQISVLIGNLPAERAYEKVAFRVERERRHPDFEAALACPGIKQMRREL